MHKPNRPSRLAVRGQVQPAATDQGSDRHKVSIGIVVNTSAFSLLLLVAGLVVIARILGWL